MKDVAHATEEDLIQAVLLASVVESGEGLTIPEISRLVDLPITTVRGLIRTLKERGEVITVKVLRHHLDDAWRRTPGYALVKTRPEH